MKPLVILTGPTAVGKTNLSISLAKKINAEIISADSMQVYKHMDIGTAKISEEDKQGIKHYLIDILEPSDAFNVTIFQHECKKAMSEIYAKGKIPLIVGGTGFYIQSVLYDIDFTSHDTDDNYRINLEILAEKNGGAYLHEMLKKCDPASAEIIHPNNVKKLIRALEFYYLTGEMISKHNKDQHSRTTPYNSAYFILDDHRKVLYERIDQRVDKMFNEGLVEEVKALRNMGYNKSFTSMQGLGYKEILDYLDGLITFEEAKYTIKRDTRHFAKRQLTWFRREKDVIRFDKSIYENENAVLNDMIIILTKKGIYLRND